jgi:hypothetical protein
MNLPLRSLLRFANNTNRFHLVALWLAFSAGPASSLWGQQATEITTSLPSQSPTVIPQKLNAVDKGDAGVSISLKLLPSVLSTSETDKKESPVKTESPKSSLGTGSTSETSKPRVSITAKPVESGNGNNSKDKSIGSPLDGGGIQLKLLQPQAGPQGNGVKDSGVKDSGVKDSGGGLPRVSIQLSGPPEPAIRPVPTPVASTLKPLGQDDMPDLNSRRSKDQSLTQELPIQGEGQSLGGSSIVDMSFPADMTSSAGQSAEPSELERLITGSSNSAKPASSMKESNRSRDADPGDPGDDPVPLLPLQPGDLPIESDSHPFDAPEAQTTDPTKRLRSSSIADLAELNDADLHRQRRIEECLRYFRSHPESVGRRGPWALMHAILPFGVETQVIAGNRQVNAIGWLCYNGVSARQRMFQPTQTGFRTNVGPGVQGHEGQFLAILAQSYVRSDYPIQIGNRRYTIQDLIKYEQATCRERTELTFKLIAFCHYLDPQQKWRDNRGHIWSIEKLVAEELAQPINGEACGGTHRLMGLTCAVVQRQDSGLPITGHFDRAQKFLNEFVAYTLALQNQDGSFSTEWFTRRADEPNLERKVQTTGHILEWLVFTLPDQHLKMPQIEKAVDFLLGTIGKDPGKDWPIGPRGHSLRALVLYHQRVYKKQSWEMAEKQSARMASPASSTTKSR